MSGKAFCLNIMFLLETTTWGACAARKHDDDGLNTLELPKQCYRPTTP